ncbi:hypothetical protein M9458_002869, partial [Cirrhinus mrigala]
GAERFLYSRGSQLDLLEGMETGDPLSPSSLGRSVARSAGSEARSAATSSHGTGSSLHLSSSEEGDLESAVEEPLPQSLQYEELLEVVTRAVSKLNIDWPAEEKAALQKISPHLHAGAFLSSLTSMLKSRGRGQDHFRLACSSPPLTIKGVYKAMPRVELTLASYLSPGAASFLKAPTLPSKPLRTTSALVGKGYTAEG